MLQRIIIIDHQNDNGSYRGYNIKEQLESLKITNLTVNFLSYIYGKEYLPNPPVWVDEMFDNIGLADIYFIHTSNDLAIDLINFINHNHSTAYIIEYSGGGISYMNNRISVSEQHCIYPNVVDVHGRFPYLNEFVQAIQIRDPDPLSKLMGFNKKLETALNFLHECLTCKHATLPRIVDEHYNFRVTNKEVSLKDLFEIWKGPLDNDGLANLRDGLLAWALVK